MFRAAVSVVAGVLAKFVENTCKINLSKRDHHATALFAF